MIGIPIVSGALSETSGLSGAIPAPVRWVAALLFLGLGVGQYVAYARGSRRARLGSMGGLMLAGVLATLALPTYPILVIIGVGLVELLRLWIGLHRDNRFGDLPVLVGHGTIYLLAAGALVAAPFLAAKFVVDHRLFLTMELPLCLMIALPMIGLALGIWAGMARLGRPWRMASLLVAGAVLSLASMFLVIVALKLVRTEPNAVSWGSMFVLFVPSCVGGSILLAELLRASLTSANPRYRILAHATLYVALYFALIAIPVLALWVFQHAGWNPDPDRTLAKIFNPDAPLLWFFRKLGWDDWLPWYVRYPIAGILFAAGLCLNFVTLRQPRNVRVLALIGVALLSVGASFFSYWLGIMLTLIVATHELLRGTLLPSADPEYRRDWKLIFNGFSAGYLAMLPPLIAMFVVRAWLFAHNTPAEEPFLDNPIRGMWMVRELGMSSFEAELVKKPMPGLSLMECKMTAVKVMGKLVYLLTWPATLCSDYSFDEFPNFTWTFRNGMEDVKTVAALFTILALLAAAAYHYRHNRAVCFLILFFFAAGLPTSNFIITIGSIMAERFMYLPLAGFTGVVVLAVFAVARWLWNSLKLRDPRDSSGGWGWSNALAGGFLSVVVCVYGARAYFRNYVWISDLTLWKDAIQTSTRSFRCYQSLAFAYFEQDARGYVDKMIDLDEAGVRIVDRLPNHLNSSRMYLHLGMYYTIKAGLMCPADQNGNPITTSDSLVWYKKAVEVLERGSEIDRSFDELNRTKQLGRGDPAWKIADVGLTPIYDVLAGAYLQMGMFDEAYRRVIYQRQLDPGDGSIYIRLAGIELARNHPREAAVALIQAILLDSTNEAAWRALIKIYDQFGPEGRGGIIIQGNIVKLNEQNPLMYQQMYESYRDLVRMFRRSRKWELAAQARRAAVEVYHFDPKLFDPLFDEPVEFVTPQGVQYDKVDTLITAEDMKMLPR
jgi:tetratricopeptide (TPR) repeat protein